MLKSQIQHSISSNFTALKQKPFCHGNDNTLFNVLSKPVSRKKLKNLHAGIKVRALLKNILMLDDPDFKPTTRMVKAIVTVKQTIGGLVSSTVGIEKPFDDLKDLLGMAFTVELVSAELDPRTGLEKDTIKSHAHLASHSGNEVKYELKFKVPDDFGEVAAILVQNERHNEMYLQDVILNGLHNGPLKITCASWIHSKYENATKRVFFTNKPCLPSETPTGIKRLREEELKLLRGNRHGERKTSDRIYDYDVYNDLGDPDQSEDLKRPVLGGKEVPYPRRCRTGRPRTKADEYSESRNTATFYVPRDESFSEIKQLQFSTRTLYQVLHALLPQIEAAVVDTNLGFSDFKSIDSLFTEGLKMHSSEKHKSSKNLTTKLAELVVNGDDYVLRFKQPETMNRDKFFWLSDGEFARQTLAGVNPYAIQLVKEWPLKSQLDPQIYGPAESAITKDLIEKEFKGQVKIDEAMKQKRLFVLEYHDLLLPYVKKVRELEGTTLYGSRTLFYLKPDGKLTPLAIELCRPPMEGKPQWKQVYTPSTHSTSGWLWRFAKAHVVAHDSGHHELVSHWLRTHCAVEPFVIATNRQLSVMHPVCKLLHPHFRYTLEINALARKALINANGIIESSFSLGKYSMELSSVAYDQQWRFDLQALPEDLKSRGMAIEDLTAPHGVRLTIEDYPFANDGLLIWDALKEWVTDYINHFYPNSKSIQSDEELQAWWTEIKTVGHGDKKDESMWPTLNTPQALIDIITTIAWVSSGHHAAVNFGKYIYGGYFPNRPTIARTKMPNEEPTDKEWNAFLSNPEAAFMQCLPSKIQATKVMAVLNVLSSHSPEEEYIGQNMEPAWAEEPSIKAAFEKYNSRIKEIERIIDERNSNMNLKNRNGAGIIPYELLKPFSEPGVTGKGVPNSISI